jgi:hypothetical protein
MLHDPKQVKALVESKEFIAAHRRLLSNSTFVTACDVARFLGHPRNAPKVGTPDFRLGYSEGWWSAIDLLWNLTNVSAPESQEPDPKHQYTTER